MARQNDEPVSVTQKLTEQDYGEAVAAVKYFAAPMRRRSIRAAVCLTVAALTAASIPLCGKNLSAKVILIAVAIIGIAVALVIWLVQPEAEKKSAVKWFRSCPLAALQQTTVVSHDHAVVENECERMTEYWTNFSICVETEELIVAAGGQERFLLLVKKSGLPPKEAERLSRLMRYAFDGRWYRMPPRKGGK